MLTPTGGDTLGCLASSFFIFMKISHHCNKDPNSPSQYTFILTFRFIFGLDS
jgi:hypothetical protein